MLFNIGDLVTRKSYDNDIVFEILNKVNKDIEKYGLEITESNIEGFEVKTNSGEIIFKK